MVHFDGIVRRIKRVSVRLVFCAQRVNAKGLYDEMLYWFFDIAILKGEKEGRKGGEKAKERGMVG